MTTKDVKAFLPECVGVSAHVQMYVHVCVCVSVCVCKGAERAKYLCNVIKEYFSWPSTSSMMLEIFILKGWKVKSRKLN